MFGYPQVKPTLKSAGTITHLIGFENQPRYQQSVKTVRSIQAKNQVNGLTPHQQRALKLLRVYKSGLSARELSAKTGFAKSSCNVILAKLYKDGLVYRRKERVALTKQYVYAIRTQAVR